MPGQKAEADVKIPTAKMTPPNDEPGMLLTESELKMVPQARSATIHAEGEPIERPLPPRAPSMFSRLIAAVQIVIIRIMASGILYLSKPPASRSFAVYNQNNDVVYPQFAFPLRDEIIPSWLAIFLGPFVPVVILLLFQVYVRSFWDANNAIFGVLYSLSNSVVFQVIIKWLIGGLRPHFLDVCKPDLSLAKTLPKHKSAYIASGFSNMYYTREICTGDPRQINDALSSFPSGHTTAAFAGFVFLSLYLNGKLKIFSHQHTQLWKMHLFFAPILVATLIGGALTIDAFHNWYDILAGAIIGTTMAFSAYRMTYAAVFDPRYNHIPLHRNKPFDYDAIRPSSDNGFTHLDHSRL
ncbi:hypothetical protein Sste5346_001402 [Sporothrix stenoceras]|uniref:Phosphatidic acid phosphatase type 2/haloperoxidase domain-containing protein n=1 Tax=Sporothrix stenoceras TaxID=5173 RepID=A0ABR3ZQ98_9PEZI